MWPGNEVEARIELTVTSREHIDHVWVVVVVVMVCLCVCVWGGGETIMSELEHSAVGEYQYDIVY